MWDGFWIHSFKRGTLVISASYDICYGSTYNFIFKKVIFFNVPYKWKDTNVVGEDAFRLATTMEFKQHHPHFDPGTHAIFAVDMEIEVIRAVYLDGVLRHMPGARELRTFFIVARHIYLQPYDPDFRRLLKEEYEDTMLGNDEYPSMKNRVLPGS